METHEAVSALAALAQDTRLRLFRLLVGRGPEGLTAGEIAQTLQIPANTLSFHLSHLTGAGLIASRREGRFIHYAVAPEGIRELLAFLSDDCCAGRPELCGLPPRASAARPGTDPAASIPPVSATDAVDDPRR